MRLSPTQQRGLLTQYGIFPFRDPVMPATVRALEQRGLIVQRTRYVPGAGAYELTREGRGVALAILRTPGFVWSEARCVLAAADRGHDVEWDPGKQQRWTCVRCGRAVLTATSGTVVYGSAATEPCTR